MKRFKLFPAWCRKPSLILGVGMIILLFAAQVTTGGHFSKNHNSAYRSMWVVIDGFLLLAAISKEPDEDERYSQLRQEAWFQAGIAAVLIALWFSVLDIIKPSYFFTQLFEHYVFIQLCSYLYSWHRIKAKEKKSIQA